MLLSGRFLFKLCPVLIVIAKRRFRVWQGLALWRLHDLADQK